MKKFLVVLLACALIFGFASTAMAADTQITEFSDIADQSQAAKNAIMKLAVLGVLEGNEGVGGAIRPADNLTRAEFAKVICYLTGNVKSAEALSSVASRFPDVQVGSWYTGWVNMAVQAGYFQGDPSGNFRPNANITMNEVVAVSLRAMGYNDKLPGSWPANYAAKANNIGVLDDVTFVGSAAATRADAFIICDAVLDKNMVVHIDNDIAFAISLSQTGNTVDKDGFAEVYYMTNEDDDRTDNSVPETILHKAFKCYYPSVVFEYAAKDGFDEVAAWEYLDFKDGELELKFEVGPYSAREVASTYYINKGFTLPELAGMQAKVIINDDDEVVFVNVRGSYVYAKVYEDSNRVVADGKTYRASDLLGKPASIKDINGGFAGSDKDNTVPAKVYIDKDGLAYAVRNYNNYDGEHFGIFDEVDDGEISYVEDTLSTKFDLKKDYVLIKDNALIKAEDLERLDVVYYLGEVASIKTWLALPSAEGELSAQNRTSGKLTLDGTAYAGVTDFMFSDNGGDDFEAPFNLKDKTIEKSSFGDAIYAKSYNFNKLAFAAANAVNTKVIGVVTKVEPASVWNAKDPTGASTPGFYPQYQQITIFNAEGKEVTYTFHKDFRNGYNALLNSALGAIGSAKYLSDDGVTLTTNWDNAKNSDGETIVAFAEGDIVQLVLDTGDKVKKIANYAAYETAGVEAKVTVSSARERITINNETGTASTEGTFTLPNNAVVFCAKPDIGLEFDEATVVSVASVLAADFKALKAVAFDVKSSAAINVLYYVGDESKVHFGIVTNEGTQRDNYYYTINGERVYNDGTVLTGISGVLDGIGGPPALIGYTMSGGEATIDSDLILAWGDGSDTDVKSGLGTLGSAYNLVDQSTGGDYAKLGDYKAVYGVVESYNSGTKAVKIGYDTNKSVYVYVGSGTFIYDLFADDDATTSDLRGAEVVAVYDPDSDNEAFAIAIVSDISDVSTSSSGGTGSFKAAALTDYLDSEGGLGAVAGTQTGSVSVSTTIDDSTKTVKTTLDGTGAVVASGTVPNGLTSGTINSLFNGEETLAAGVVTLNIADLLDAAGFGSHTAISVRASRSSRAPQYPGGTVTVPMTLSSDPWMTILVFPSSKTTLKIYDSTDTTLLLTLEFDGFGLAHS